MPDETQSTNEQLDALRQVLDAFTELVNECEASGDRQLARACVRIARDLYGPVREIAEELRLSHGEIPSIRADIARLDETLH